MFQESTEDFEGQQMIEIFGDLYEVIVLFLSPADMGYWCNRPRKFAFMVLRGRFVFVGDVRVFARMFFRARVQALGADCGHMYWCAPRSLSQEARLREAARQHVVLADSDDDSDWEPVLPLGDRKRLAQYRDEADEALLERAAEDVVAGRVAQAGISDHIARLRAEMLSPILNIKHNAGEKGGTNTQFVPTLLRTSRVYSEKRKRLIFCGEKLQVQGVLFSMFVCVFPAWTFYKRICVYIYIYIYIYIYVCTTCPRAVFKTTHRELF